MKKILVTYASMAGSTAEVSQAVGEEIASRGAQVEVLPLRQVKQLAAYDGVVVGAPMIMGWHREALRFLKKNRETFKRIPIAVFITAMSLTQDGKLSLDGVPVHVDRELAKPPVNAQRLSFKERYARLKNYTRPILKAIQPVKPASLGVFAGRLEYGRLKWWAVLFAMLVIQAPAGDRRDWQAIRAWAASLSELMQARTAA